MSKNNIILTCLKIILFILILSSYSFASDYSSKSISEKNYKGITLHAVSHQKPNLGGPVERHANQFEKLTGVKIIIDFIEFKELYPKIIWGLKKDEYDIIFCGREWLADLVPYLAPLPDKMLSSTVHKTIPDIFKELGMWDGKYYLVEIDGDRHFMQYRKDIFENPAYKSEFRSKYTRELEPPKTWNEYAEVAKFFNKRKIDNGQTIYGSSEITAKDDLVYTNFFKRAASYAKHPDVKGGFYFDLKTMKPLINTPGFVQALQDLVDMQDYFPPGGDNFTLVDALVSFGSGQTVLSDSWGDGFLKAMEPKSIIRNKVAASLSPGSKRVWNRNTGKWDNFPEINHVPYIPGSWTSAVAKNSKHQDAAFDFLGFFRNSSNHYEDVLNGSSGINAFYETDYRKELWTEQAGWNDDVADSYVKMMKNFTDHSQHVFIMNLIRGRQYNKDLNIGITRAMKKKNTPQEALDDVAHKWEKLTQIVGVDKQRKAYANMVKLEDN